MLYHAKNGRINGMDDVRFGTGNRILILLPGLGDGLQTVKGTAIPMALTYRSLAKDFTVYLFSRKDPLPEGQSTRDMARDLKVAMDSLDIRQADIVGVSMGGMIAQWLAVDHSRKVSKLVLVVTAPCPNESLVSAIEEWKAFARQGNHTALMDSNVRRIYSDTYYQKNKWLVPIMGKLTRPKSYDRFLIQAQACKSHDALEFLPQITAPTLILAGEKDRIIGSEAARVMAETIPNARLQAYPQWGHGLYEEEKDFLPTVLAFLQTE